MNKTVNPRDILLRPVISEKSLRLADDGKYTFIVAPGSHKTQIRQAVEATFSVTVTDSEGGTASATVTVKTTQ